MEKASEGEGLSILLVGAAGEGVQTIGSVLANTVALSGYPVFTWQDFESRVRGGHSSYALRLSARYRNAPEGRADLILALNESALDHYRPRLKPGGMVVRPASETKGEDELAFSFSEVATKRYGGQIYANSVASGYLCALLELSKEHLTSAVRSNFKHKDKEVVESNILAAQGGYDLGPKGAWRLPSGLSTPGDNSFPYLISGHEAVAHAAVASGLRFISAYPMSPSTSIISHLAEIQEKVGVFLVQAEDEIGAINMVLGASYGGARAMTCTSGGGFALMAEAISLAGMTETPAVIVVAMRPGPATGLPTRTAQGDLLFAVNSGHGEFPKAVLAPSDAADVFPTVRRAFDLADRFQMPVILLTDQHLADSRYLISPPTLDPGLRRDHLGDPGEVPLPYMRYRLNPEEPLSPRLYPGQSAHLVCADSDEHDEAGHITEDLESTVVKMVAKRDIKTEKLRLAMEKPKLTGAKDPDLVLVSWGSTLHAVDEAVDRLNEKGVKTAHQHFTDLWPLPRLLPPGGRLVTVEGNGSGQLQKLLKGEAGYHFHGHVGRTDGLPLDSDYILDGLKGII